MRTKRVTAFVVTAFAVVAGCAPLSEPDPRARCERLEREIMIYNRCENNSSCRTTTSGLRVLLSHERDFEELNCELVLLNRIR